MGTASSPLSMKYIVAPKRIEVTLLCGVALKLLGGNVALFAYHGACGRAEHFIGGAKVD
jgi:hypothetical protein